MIIFAPKLLGISILDAAIMGAVVGVVSPAVIVPKMLKLMEEGYGVRHSIPQLILAGASVDDVFVIVMFTAFTGLAQGNDVSTIRSFVNIPISILLGIVTGAFIGILLAYYFKKVHIRDTSKVIIIVTCSPRHLNLTDFEVGASCSIALQGKAKTGYPRVSRGSFLSGYGSFLCYYAHFLYILFPSSRILTAAFTSRSIRFPHSHRYVRSDNASSFFLCKELISGYLDGITGEYAAPAGYLVNKKEAEAFDRKFPYMEKKKLPGQIF